jgi:hypothetical protein
MERTAANGNREGAQSAAQLLVLQRKNLLNRFSVKEAGIASLAAHRSGEDGSRRLRHAVAARGRTAQNA